MKRLFYYDKSTLSFEKLKLVHYLHLVWIFALMFVLGYFSRGTIIEKIFHRGETIFVRPKQFSEDSLVELLNNCNIKYPYIVLAQAKLESSNFTSKIFRQNHNMFGMRKAHQRITTAQTEKDTYAYYETWTDCVYDYCLYQSSVMCNVINEEGYFVKLGEKYAEDPLYVSKLKNIIQREKLKSMFEE